MHIYTLKTWYKWFLKTGGSHMRFLCNLCTLVYTKANFMLMMTIQQGLSVHAHTRHPFPFPL